MVATLFACIAFQLNASMLSPALVTMQRELATTSASIAATQTAFFTAAALFSLFLPRFGDLVGRRRVLVGMLLLMTVGCVISALATNVTVVFIGRLLQGVSGPTVPLCMVMLRALVQNPKLYGFLMGLIAAVNGGIAGFDALAGGYLATNFGFAAVFWAMAGVAALATLLVRLLAGESSAHQSMPMDWLGAFVLVVALGTLLVAANDLGKLSGANLRLVIPLLVVSAVAFALFWRIESRRAHPLVYPSQLKERATWAVVGTAFLTLCGVFAIMNGIVPALAQEPGVGMGLSAEETSLWVLTPYAIAGLLAGPLSGRLAATVGYRTILRIGLIGSAALTFVFAINVPAHSKAVLLVLAVAIGVTYAGMANIMLNGLGVVLSPQDRPGSLPGLNTAGFNLGAALSFVAIYGVQTAFTATGNTVREGYVAALVAGAVIIVGALAMSLFIPRPVAAEIGG
jgi:MFS family permease